MEEHMSENNITTRSMLRYPGGKTRAIKTLLPFVPQEVSSVCSPFFGGGSFELSLTQRGITVEAYDIFAPLSIFWQQTLLDPQHLADTIQPYLGNITKEKFKHYQQEIQQDNLDDTHIATLFFILNRCSFSGATLSGGFSQSASVSRFTQSSIDKIRNFYNPLIHVNTGDAFEVIDNTDADMLFLDPPYKLDDSFLYGVRGNTHKGFDHNKLCDILHDKNMPFIMTYNDSDEIRDLYKDYDIQEASWSYGMNKSKKSSEIIIIG